MRILLIANTLPPRDVSGVGEQVLQLAAGLRSRGHEVEVLGRGPGGARGPKLLFPIAVVPATAAALRRFRPHVVQVHESDGALAALLVAMVRWACSPRPRLAALLQVSYVEERWAVRPLRDPEGRELGRPGAVERRFRRFKAPVQVVLGRLTARLADVVLAPSAATAAELRCDYGVERVAVVPNVTGGLPVVAEAAAVALEEEIAPGALLFVGRLRIRKGVEVAFAALRLLAAGPSPPGPLSRKSGRGGTPPDGSVPRLLVAGDGEHRGALEAAAAGLAGVQFLGRCDASRIRRLLGGAAALVVPSTYEGMPLVVLEAMAAGVPVVASRVSGIPEVVVDGETGWLVPPEDPAALALALAEVLADAGEARRRGEAGRRRVEERFRPLHAAAAWERAVLGAEMERSS
jgi:glycosyltransferase involved in cell wall biosynthesis